MNWMVNGEAVEFERAHREVRVRDGLLMVRTADGWRTAAVARVGRQVLVSFRGRQYWVSPVSRAGRAATEDAAGGELRAPIPGVVIAVNYAVGDRLDKGQTVLLLEAMKTQIPLAAPFDGNLTGLSVSLGDPVSANQLLAEVKP